MKSNKEQIIKSNKEKTHDRKNQTGYSIPNNRNLRIKTDFQTYSRKKPNQEQQLDEYTDNNNSYKKQSSSKAYRQFLDLQLPPITINSKPKRSQTYNLQIPFDTQQLNRDMSKVLSQIQQIEQMRKLSSQNSLQMKSRREQFMKVRQIQAEINLESRFNMKESKVKKENAFWDQLMDKIKKPVNYAEKSLEYIDKEKVQLVQLVKNLNQRLNKKLQEVQNSQLKNIRDKDNLSSVKQRRHRTQTSGSQIDNQKPLRNERSPSALQFQKSLVQLVQEINTNEQLISNMSNELAFLTKKYENYQQSLKNYPNIQQEINKVRQLIKLKKEQLSRIRKKKFLTQRAIIKIERKNGNLFPSATDVMSTNCTVTTNASNDLLTPLKQQYSQLLKKRQKLQNKIQLNNMHLNKIQELKDKHNVNKEHYDELVDEINRISPSKEINQSIIFLNKSRLDKSRSKDVASSPSLMKKLKNSTQMDHPSLMYRSKHSKLQLLISTIKRSEEALKRKYYNLLRQYQTVMGDEGLSNVGNKMPVNATGNSQKTKKMSSILRENEQIIQAKLKNSKKIIEELENKVERIKKTGKIIRKANVIAQDNEQVEQPQQQEYYDDDTYQYEFDDEMSPPKSITLAHVDNKSFSTNNNIDRSFTTSNQNPTQRHSLLSKSKQSSSFTTNLIGNSRIRSSSHKDTMSQIGSHPFSPINSAHGLDLKSDNVKEFREEDADLKELNNILGKRQMTDNKNLGQGNIGKKYIGRLKKQRIAQKGGRIRPNSYIQLNGNMSDLTEQAQEQSPTEQQFYTASNPKKSTYELEQHQVIVQQLPQSNDIDSSRLKQNQNPPSLSDNKNNVKQVNSKASKKANSRLQSIPSNNSKGKAQVKSSEYNTSSNGQLTSSAYNSETNGELTETQLNTEEQEKIEEVRKQVEVEMREERVKEKYAKKLFSSKILL